MDTKYVSCEVGTEFLNIIERNIMLQNIIFPWRFRNGKYSDP
jgi:hypothetical protein